MSRSGPRPRSSALGVFDSGLGGLTVVRALRELLPQEHIVYLGDTARVPYGTRSAETVVRYARGCANLLIQRDIKALVIACNTVSAVAVEMLRAEFDLPVIGVVDPGASAAVGQAERLGGAVRIGVLGTAGTVASGAYPRAVGRLSTRFEVVAQAAPLLVPLVEEGWLEGEVPRLAIQRYLEPLIEAEVGVIVLGCTHYPLLKPMIEQVAAQLAGHPVPIVDSAQATAIVVQQLLEERELGSLPAADEATDGQLEVLVSDLPKSFASVAEAFLGHPIEHVAQVDVVVG
ncbi:MAG: glutamate racemase [Polyangiaceae bacterium]